MNIKDFSQLIERTQQAESVSSLKGICQEFCDRSGIEYFILTMIENKSLYSSTLKSESNLEEHLINNIFSNKDKTNHFLSCQVNRQTPQSWSNKTKAEQNTISELIHILSNNGFNSGINIPIKTHNGDLVYFNMVSKIEWDFDLLDSVLLYAHTFVTHLISTYLRIKENSQPIKRLSQRESDCLFWACEGKTAWEIAKIIGLSQRTVTFHLMNIIEKLRANNRQHAVALAIMKGIVKPNFEKIQPQI